MQPTKETAVKNPPHLSRRTFLRQGSAAAAAATILPGRLIAQERATAKRAKSHKYEDLLPEEFYAELERAPIAYWGCGSMEEHGLQ
ncbi:MAG: twin-arginine translocation signal domain-containing protein, partial [Verrucomicrobia bacterium]|nr:twin-arginine translocation signal domain-containing protein [Verrucomicrobiota bacterium]